VAIVAGLGVTGGVWLSDNGTSGSTASHQRVQDKAGGGAALAPTVRSSEADASALKVCPDTTRRFDVSRPADLTQRSASVFGPNVTAISVCSYGSELADMKSVHHSHTRAVAVTDQKARDLVHSLNSAATRPPSICPQFRPQQVQHYVLIGQTAEGKLTEPVEITLSANRCQTTVTNGSALRYGWTPPRAVQGIFAAAGNTQTVPLPKPSTS
jgi:hypothetical protein